MNPLDAESHFLEVNGLDIHYYVAGDPTAPTVILLHGGGIDSAKVAWRHLTPVLARTHRVYAPDLPGYGESSPPNAPYTTRLLIDTVRGFIAGLGIGACALLGLSMGGATALGYTLEHPEQVTRLILVDSYGLQRHAPLHPLSVMALRLPQPITRWTWAQIAQSRPMLWSGLAAIYFNRLALDAQTLADAAESIHLDLFYAWLAGEVRPEGCLTDYSDQLPTLHTPTLLIHGQFDPSIPLVWGQQAADRLPNGQLVMIPLAGHWVNRERPTLFNREVVKFLLAEEKQKGDRSFDEIRHYSE